MTHYTIFVADQKPGVEHTIVTPKPNCAGQLIAFDEPSTKADAQHFARICCDYWDRVQLFAGKNLGKQIPVWDGTTI